MKQQPQANEEKLGAEPLASFLPSDQSQLKKLQLSLPNPISNQELVCRAPFCRQTDLTAMVKKVKIKAPATSPAWGWLVKESRSPQQVKGSDFLLTGIPGLLCL